jgi:undecaprenyl-phosphate galactose phosphotransferase
MIVVCLEGFIFFAIKYQFSRLWITLAWVNAFVFLLIGRKIARSICDKMGLWAMPTLIIGNGSNLVETLYAVYSENYTGYDVREIIINDADFVLNGNELPSEYKNIKQTRVTDIEQFLKTVENQFIIVAYDTYKDIDIELLLRTLNQRNINYAVVPPLKGMPLYGAPPQYFFGYDIIFLHSRHKILSPVGRLMKRAVDIIGGGCVLLLGLPFFAIVAILIKKDGGPIFYSQDRIGQGGVHFKLWKFRSMAVNADKILQDVLDKNPQLREDWQIRRKIEHDPRITKIGNFIRKASIDELPQIINVLKGDMSLIGPRPILPDEVIFFNEEQLKTYCSVKPGITGLWQVSGRNNTTFKYRVYLDTWYVENWSFWYDIVIVFKTIGALLGRTGAY